MFWMIVIGILGGIFGGMGMGGGTLLIPMLTIFLSFAQKEAQTVSLVSFVFMAAFALIIHLKNRLIDFKTGSILAVFGLMSAVGMAFVARSISNGVLKILFGVFLIILAIIEFVNLIKQKNNN